MRILENGNLMSCSDDSTIREWSWSKARDNWQINQTLSGHASGVTSLRVLSNGSPISGSRDKSIKIWNKETSQVIQTISVFTSEIWSLLELNKNQIVVGTASGQIKLINSNPIVSLA